MGSSDARGEAVIWREEAKLERTRAKVKAFEENMTSTIASALKNERTKKSIARDAMAATKDPSRGDAIFNKAGSGAYDNDRDPVVTGEEPRPWEE